MVLLVSIKNVTKKPMKSPSKLLRHWYRRARGDHSKEQLVNRNSDFNWLEEHNSTSLDNESPHSSLVKIKTKAKNQRRKLRVSCSSGKRISCLNMTLNFP